MLKLENTRVLLLFRDNYELQETIILHNNNFQYDNLEYYISLH